MGFRRSGPLTAWRLANSDYPIFDGAGAAKYGARWSSPGRFVVYAAEHFATAMLENLAHFNIGRLPRMMVAAEIAVPADFEIEVVMPPDVPGWNANDLVASRRFGDEWYDGGINDLRPAVLLVPSVVALHEFNVLINQRHHLFHRVRAGAAEPVIWDPRLLPRHSPGQGHA